MKRLKHTLALFLVRLARKLYPGSQEFDRFHYQLELDSLIFGRAVVRVNPYEEISGEESGGMSKYKSLHKAHSVEPWGGGKIESEPPLFMLSPKLRVACDCPNSGFACVVCMAYETIRKDLHETTLPSRRQGSDI